MKLVTVRNGKSLQLGVKSNRGVIVVDPKADTNVPKTVKEVLEGGQQALFELAAYVSSSLESGHNLVEEDQIQYGPCVPNPGKIICIGTNYRKHAIESNLPIPEYPVLFNKFSNSLAAHGEEVELPPNSQQVDYEAELTLVIGKRAKNVPKEQALDYVFGYCNANDLSARDLQFRTSQWLTGKSCDGFCPIGPYLVTADEVRDPNQLSIRTYVNGELRQNSNTSDMIFPCDELVSYLSRFMTLEPGDIILTGTPEGVIFGYPKDQQVWLKDGDEITIEVEKLGRLTNRMKKAN